MKHIMTLIGIGVAALVLPVVVQAQKSPAAKADQEKKNTRHIKMTKIENGKKMELDTVLTGNDVFVWQGDTVNPPKHITYKVRHSSGKPEKFDVKVDSNGKTENVMVFRHKGGKDGDPVIMKLDSARDIEILTEDPDSLGKRIVLKKRMKGGSPDHMIYFNDAEGMPFPPVPPPPPVPHVKMLKKRFGGRVIDLNSPDIISYKKKSLSGDREKIEIIRKKSGSSELMNFEFNEDMVAPEPPEMPEVPDHVMNFDGHKMKVTRKDVKVDGKDGQEIKVEIEKEENKK